MTAAKGSRKPTADAASLLHERREAQPAPAEPTLAELYADPNVVRRVGEVIAKAARRMPSPRRGTKEAE